MRINSDQWSITSAVKTGHDHLYSDRNCQDAEKIAAGPSIAIGISCDGCGEGDHSEMGAISLANFGVSELVRFHHTGQYTPTMMVQSLFKSIVRYIDFQVMMTCRDMASVQIAHFIKHHWLATIMGMIIPNEEQKIVFWCGDGVYAFGDETVILDQDNTPTYIAYNCIDVPLGVGVTPEVTPSNFQYAVLPDDVTRVMIASDGFDHHTDKVEKPLHGEQWEKKGKVGLKKWMNTRHKVGYFADDCAIVTAEKRVIDA